MIIDEYRAAPGLNQSSIKKILSSGITYRNVSDDESSPGKDLGSVVDMLLTGGDISQIAVDQDFKISDRDKKFIKDAMKYGPRYAYDAGKYKQPASPEEVLLKLQEPLEFYTLNKDKLIVQADVYELAQQIAYSLRNSEVSRDYFINSIGQTVLYFQYQGVNCKAKLDLLDIDNGIIADIKTTSFLTIQFVREIKKYRYDIQAAFYLLAVEEALGLKLDRFDFVVESSTVIGRPMVYHVHRSALGKAFEDIQRVIDLIKNQVLKYDNVTYAPYVIKKDIMELPENIWV